jgi:hypothetical protein
MEDPKVIPEIPAKPPMPETDPRPHTPETPQVPTQPVTVPEKQPVPAEQPTQIPPKELMAYVRLINDRCGYNLNFAV